MNKIIFKEVEEVSFSTRGIQDGKRLPFSLYIDYRIRSGCKNRNLILLVYFYYRFFFFFLVQYLKSLKFEIVNNNIEPNNEDPIKEKWTT